MNYSGIYGHIKAATEKAVLLVQDDAEWWIPRSVIDGGEELTVGDMEEEIYVADWFCEKEGIS